MLRSRTVGNQSGFSVRGGGKVLLLSMRSLARLVAYCTVYEFEDVVAEATSADRIDVSDERALELSRRSYKLLRFATRSPALASRTAVPPATVRLDRDYELFFPVFNHTHELYALRCVPDWRRRCRFAACFVSEVWAHLLPQYLLELLAQFDHVFIGMKHCVDDVARIVGRPCSYLPVAADVLQFSPWPQPPARTVDVCNIGRRSAVTHAALLELARAREICYYYDTFAGGAGRDREQRTFRVHDHREHRLLLAQTLMRTKYYVANRSRVNQPEYTGLNQEISYRFYEGIAAGAVLLGEPPETEVFRELFDWPDAVIRVPFDCPEIGRVLADLERDPERLARIRAQNMTQAALRHDWVHRLGQVCDTLGVSRTEGMRERQTRLDAIAQSSRKVAA